MLNQKMKNMSKQVGICDRHLRAESKKQGFARNGCEAITGRI
ncbi:hypothetical protein [Ligilactobacillus ruminis]|nr:hypothetical protein [Ligilactobacillus ruminis]